MSDLRRCRRQLRRRGNNSVRTLVYLAHDLAEALHQCIEGDRSLFIRFDEVEWSWKVVDPILRHFSLERDFIQTYPAGSWGPEQASRLFDSPDQSWRNDI